MMFSRRLAGAAASVAIVAAAGVAIPAQASVSQEAAAASYTPPPGETDPCPAAAANDAGCAVLIGTPAAASPAATAPSGLSPASLQQAYDLQGSTSGSGQTVAIVTPYGDTWLASDLAAYRTQYGISPCTVADGCLTIVSQTGSTTSLPPANAGWDTASTGSADMISAICPNCHITVVEASSGAIADLGTAENEAVALGAKFVDNDWTTGETSAETGYDTSYFSHPGVAITAPAGNNGYGTSYPAASPGVIAVGGTTLTADTSSPRGYDEAAWAGSGAGCSAYEAKPSWQTDTGCTGRTMNDLSADAGTAVAYYDTPTGSGWGVLSGTAVASAIVAATNALAGTPGSSDNPAQYPYQHPGGTYTTPGSAYTSATGLNPVTSGSDGTCSVSYLCTAGAGYSGPAGLGSPATALSLTSGGGQTGPFYSGVTGICLDDKNDATTTGNVVQIWNCLGDASQRWTANPDGTITIASGYCLDLTGGATTDGTPIELNPCVSGSSSQQWAPQANGEIINPASGKCLDDPGVSTANGTQLDLWTCHDGSNQQWAIPYSRPSGTGAVHSKITGATLCLDDKNDSTANGNTIQIWNCLGDASQNWTVEADGTIQLSPGKCAATANDGITNGTAIVLWTCTGDTNQHWTEHSDGSLVNVRSGLCLSDPNASTSNGTATQLSPCNSQVQQTWTLP